MTKTEIIDTIPFNFLKNFKIIITNFKTYIILKKFSLKRNIILGTKP